LEVRLDRGIRGDDDTYIVITHRSVREFLSRHMQEDKMRRYLNGFDALDAISQLTLAELWAREPGDVTRNSSCEEAALSLVRWRFKTKVDRPPYHFLVSLALACQRHEDEGTVDCDDDNFHLATGSRTYYLVAPASHPGESRDRLVLRLLRHPIYSAAYYGNYGFVQWELGRNPAAIPLFTPLRLLYCLLANEECTAPQILCDVVDCLYTHGLRPETASSLSMTFLKPIIRDQTNDFDFCGGENTEVTLWHQILLRSYCCEIYNLRPRYSPSDLRLRFWGYIMERFLEYGADPYFYISVTSSPKWRVKVVMRVGTERQEHWLETKSVIWSALYECEDMSLTDFVERCGFENKSRIIELIKRNTLTLEGSNQAKDLTERLEMVDSVVEISIDQPSMETTLSSTDILVDSLLTRSSLLECTDSASQKVLSFGASISVGILVLGIVISLLTHLFFY